WGHSNFQTLRKIGKKIAGSPHSYLLIIDEVSRLNPSCMRTIQDLYEASEGRLSMVLAGTPLFKNRMERWKDKNNAVGMAELYSRIGLWAALNPPVAAELKDVAVANGVTDDAAKQIARQHKDYRTLTTAVKKQKFVDNL
ncbi:MAG: ATP-binding protein, partial [Cyclobacteriaceae bacterium]|nr:ATP-binding protein [Cyclobacteriaceae bacterium]